MGVVESKTKKPQQMLRLEIGVRVFPLLSAEDLLCIDLADSVSRHPGACIARLPRMQWIVFLRAIKNPAHWRGFQNGVALCFSAKSRK